MKNFCNQFPFSPSSLGRSTSEEFCLNGSDAFMVSFDSPPPRGVLDAVLAHLAVASIAAIVCLALF